jgi:hypothetical protein
MDIRRGSGVMFNPQLCVSAFSLRGVDVKLFARLGGTSNE